MPPLSRRAGQHLWRALCASLLAEAAGFGGLNYVHRPATDFTTYNALNSQRREGDRRRREANI